MLLARLEIKIGVSSNGNIAQKCPMQRPRIIGLLDEKNKSDLSLLLLPTTSPNEGSKRTPSKI